MTLFRHKKTGRKLYVLYKTMPRAYTGGWYEASEFISGNPSCMKLGKTRKLNNSSFKLEDFIPVAYR